ncbi:MAG: hypothetical protein H6R19_3013 [Proteobacteria bacterium]|nr:hypothetical protein [Pseudomonadota bacterium]
MSTSSPPPQSPARRFVFRLLPRTVRDAVILAVILGLAVPSLIAYFVEQHLTAQTARQEVQQDLRRGLDMLSLSMRPLLWELSRSNAEAIAQAVLNDERYVSIVITSELGPQPFVKLERPVAAGTELVRAERDIEHQGKLIGHLAVAMTTAPYLAAGQRALRWNTLKVGVMLISAITLILLVLQHRLFSPLRQLKDAALLIADKQFTTPIVLPWQDELGKVGATMEQMRQALLRTFEALNEKNRELAHHAGTLEQRVVERTQALTHANEELQSAMLQLQTAQQTLIESEKLASLGRLVAGVAHELNTPIGNAMTVVSTLEDHFRTLLAQIEAGSLTRSAMQSILESTQEGQDLIHRNLARASEIIQHFKQLTIDQTTDMRRKFDLAETMEEVMITLRPNFKHSPLRLETLIPPGIEMDNFPGPLGQVITNLAMNSLNHAFPHATSGLVRIKASRTGTDMLTINVSDDGIGMSQDVRKHAFDPFFTTKLGQGGSGLGLHIVRNIVTGLLGGQIELHSEAGKGCTFSIMLPLIAPEKPARQA